MNIRDISLTLKSLRHYHEYLKSCKNRYKANNEDFEETQEYRNTIIEFLDELNELDKLIEYHEHLKEVEKRKFDIKCGRITVDRYGNEIYPRKGH